MRPRGLYYMLKWISRQYKNPMILVTENGYSEKPGLNDVDRTRYYEDCLNAVLDAIEEGVDVRGYTAWSLMDSFEWSAGYTANFGLYHVDFNSPARTRTPKLSAEVYARICKSNKINFDYSELLQEFARKDSSSSGGTPVTSLWLIWGLVTSVLSVRLVKCVSMF